MAVLDPSRQSIVDVSTLNKEPHHAKEFIQSQEIGTGLMRTSLIIIFVCVFFSGCRVNPRAEREIALLRAEILDLEDQYYALKSRCPGAGSAFANDGEVYYDSAIVNENFTTGSVIYEDAPGVYSKPNGIDDSPRSIIESPLKVDEPIIDSYDSLEQIVPAAGDSGSSTNRLPKKASYKNNRNELPLDYRDAAINKIVINRRYSQGRNIDGVQGHEGLELLIQPIGRSGDVQKVAGQLTVRIVEQDAPSVERQIGLWQFTPAETSSFFVKDEVAQQGILLHLPWNGLVPAGNQVAVFVSFTTADRRTTSASRRIKINPPASTYSPDDPLVAGWIERDERWQDIEFESFEQMDVTSDDSGSTVQESPSFRTKTPTTESRISAPGWRPVR